MMAQTKLETGFGTMGAGRPTSRHSLFGVNRRYSDYNSAIEDYCILLRKSYLGETKTEHDLMKNYVTLSGRRYAANRRYEIELSAEYKKIKNNTQIYELWKELKKNS
jgi:flagellum-specific peptidoglycan hydrolase FlgJ